MSKNNNCVALVWSTTTQNPKLALFFRNDISLRSTDNFRGLYFQNIKITLPLTYIFSFSIWRKTCKISKKLINI